MNTNHLKKWFNADTSKINSMLEKTHKLCKRHFTFNKNMQRHTEKGHLGSMNYEDLVLLKKLTMEIEEIGKISKKI